MSAETQQQYADSGYTAPEGGIVTQILDQYRQACENRRASSANAQLNLSFLAGFQWTRGSRSRGVVPIANSVNEQRVTENVMWDAFRWRQQQLAQEAPVPVAIEGGLDVSDAESAMVASRLMRYWRDHCGLADAMEDAGRWSDVSGVSYLVPSWRDSITRQIKRKVELDEPKRVLHQSGLALLTFSEDKVEVVKTGDLVFDVYSSLQVHPLPCNADSWEKVNAIIIADAVSKETLDRWLKQAKLKTPEELDAMAPVSMNMEMLRNINAMVNPTFGSNAVDPRETQYLILQYRERPCKDYPNGRYVIVAGNQVVYDDALPYVEEAREIDPNDVKNLTMGVVPLFCTKFPGRLMPPSICDAMRSMQVELNRVLTDRKQNRMTIGRNRLLTREGSLRSEWTSEHGENIEYGGSDKPEFLPGLPLVGIENEIAAQRQSFDMLSGRPEVLQGLNLPQVRSSWHMSIIREAASWVLSEAALAREKATSMVMQLSLAIGRRRYTFNRLATIYGRDNLGDVPNFFKANLRTDVVIEKGSLIPRSHAEFEAKIMEAYQYGLFTKEEQSVNDNEAVREMLGMGSMNLGLSGKELERKRVRRENAMLGAGELFAPFQQDDHDLHIKEHMRYMQTVEFQESPVAIQQAFWAHTNLHNTLLSDILMPGNPVPPPGQDEELPPEMMV